MKRIGLLIAVEIDSLLKKDFTYTRTEHVGKFDIYIYELDGKEIVTIRSGCGQVKAGAAAEILISLYHVDFIINFGIVGALTEGIGIHQVCLIDNIIDYAFDTSEADGCEVGRHLDYPSIFMPSDRHLLDKAMEIFPELKKVNCASGAKFVSTEEEKSRIHRTFNADIIDMESAGILLVADMHDTAVLFVKGISDTLHGGKEEFLSMYRKASETCVQIIIKMLTEI